jgi:hypothetical protein
MPINLGGNEFNSLGTKLLNNTTIPTSSLSYYWDAGLTDSYPGSGTTWFDFMGSRNGTLNNGPVYNSGNGGYIAFDGSNDSNTFSTFSLGNGNIAWTVYAWIRTTSGGSASLGQGSVFSNSSGGPVYSSLCVNSNVIAYWTYYSGDWRRITGTTAVNDGNWKLLTWVQKSNYYMDGYVNGALDLNNGYAESGNNNPIDIMGASWAGNFQCNIGLAAVYYGTSHSQSQILQFYNGTRQRFGI